MRYTILNISDKRKPLVVMFNKGTLCTLKSIYEVAVRKDLGLRKIYSSIRCIVWEVQYLIQLQQSKLCCKGCCQPPYDVTPLQIAISTQVKGRRRKLLVRLGSYKPTTFRLWVVDKKQLLCSILLDKFIIIHNGSRRNRNQKLVKQPKNGRE